MSFINEIAPHAQRIHKQFGILASLIIAQAIHESNWGKSGLAVNGKNLFGVKGSYNGQSITMKTWEVYNGKNVYVDAAFRKFPSWYESIEDHAKLLLNGVSWDRNKYKKVVGETDYVKACRAIQSAGYATDPQYANKLIRIIEQYKLTQYDTSTVNSSTETKDATAKKYKTLYLPSTATEWTVYKLDKPPVKANKENHAGTLKPSKFGGLQYDIFGNPQKDVYTIQTKDFGKVNIYVGSGTGAIIK